MCNGMMDGDLIRMRDVDTLACFCFLLIIFAHRFTLLGVGIGWVGWFFTRYDIECPMLLMSW
jgi:hypothetical protein